MIGSTIVHLDIVDSTNNYAAKELLTKSLNEGTLFIATCQQAGRGTGLATWESADGLNLTFTVVLYPSGVALSQQFSLSQTISLGVSDFLSRFISDVSVKWPNDIYVNDKKIAGILIETAITGGKFSRALAGIGLNINQEIFVSDAPNPVSLKNLTGKTYELFQMLTDLCTCLENRYRSLIRGDYFILQHDYGKLLYRKGVWANYRDQNSDFEGRIIGVEVDGRLQIETRKGEVREFYFKEVSFK